MEIREVEIGSLKPYPKNAKQHDAKQIANVANSIKRFGWQQPLVIDDAGVVVIGHCRLLAAKKLGLKTVPVTVASGLTEDEIRELRIADNKTNESPWDFELLQEDLEGLEFEGFEFGFGLENGDDDEEEEKVKGEIPFAEVLDEENNYIVLKFSDHVDWIQLESLFELPKVRNYSTRKDGKVPKGFNRKGVGRVVNGIDFLNKLGVSL